MEFDQKTTVGHSNVAFNGTVDFIERDALSTYLANSNLPETSERQIYREDQATSTTFLNPSNNTYGGRSHHYQTPPWPSDNIDRCILFNKEFPHYIGTNMGLDFYRTYHCQRLLFCRGIYCQQ